MARKTIDGANTANERRKMLETARLEKREAALSEMPEFCRIVTALRELGESALHPVMRREILALSEAYQRALDLRQQEVDMLAGPGLLELLLPSGTTHRLQEAGISTVQQVRQALADGGLSLRRIPSIGNVACDEIRAHLEAFDTSEPPPQKNKRLSKQVTLTKREKVLAEKMGLSTEQASELLKGAR